MIAVDDLELDNSDQPATVARIVADAVRNYLHHMSTTRWSMAKVNKVAKRVQERCSFHLFAPMIEAYFFGEAAALARAGALRTSMVNPLTQDVEQFATSDPDYLSPIDQPKPSWRRPTRERHPKHYLRFLTDSAEDGFGSYRETHEGVSALKTLDWHRVASNATHVQLLRSLVADVADAIGVTPPLPGARHPATSGPSSVLRNA